MPPAKRWTDGFQARIASRADAESRGLFGWAEYLLKWATAALGLVAAIGLPAIAIHLARFDVPLSTATYEDILRAGILPGAALVIVAMYCLAATRAMGTIGWRGFLALHGLLLLPAALLVYLLMLAGTLSYLLVIVWGMLWPFRALLERVSDVRLSNRELLIIAAALVLTCAAVLLLLKFTRSYWSGREGRFWVFLRGLGDESGDERRSGTEAEKEAQAVHSPEKKARSPWLPFLLVIPGFALMLYCIKWLMWLWDPTLGALVPHRHILYTSFATGAFLFALFFLAPHFAGTAPATRRQKRAFFAVAFLVYVLFEVAYCMWGYPRIYSGLGGGRPYSVTLWLKGDDDGRDISSVLTRARMSANGSFTRVDEVFVIFDRQGDLLLTDSPVGPGKAVLVNKGRLMGLSW